MLRSHALGAVSSFAIECGSQRGKCGICGIEFADYSNIVPDHIHPCGMGGAWRDDHPDSIQAVHW